MKKTPAQKIRDYLKLPKRDAYIKKQNVSIKALGAEKY
jgi:hypothetical protein